MQIILCCAFGVLVQNSLLRFVSADWLADTVYGSEVPLFSSWPRVFFRAHLIHFSMHGIYWSRSFWSSKLNSLQIYCIYIQHIVSLKNHILRHWRNCALSIARWKIICSRRFLCFFANSVHAFRLEPFCPFLMPRCWFWTCCYFLYCSSSCSLAAPPAAAAVNCRGYNCRVAIAATIAASRAGRRKKGGKEWTTRQSQLLVHTNS